MADRTVIVSHKARYDLRSGQSTPLDKHAVLYLGHGEEDHPIQECTDQACRETSQGQPPETGRAFALGPLTKQGQGRGGGIGPEGTRNQSTFDLVNDPLVVEFAGRRQDERFRESDLEQALISNHESTQVGRVIPPLALIAQTRESGNSEKSCGSSRSVSVSKRGATGSVRLRRSSDSHDSGG